MLYRCKLDRFTAYTDCGVVDAYIIGKDKLPENIQKQYNCISGTREDGVQCVSMTSPLSGFTYLVTEGNVIWLHEGLVCICGGNRFHQEFHPIVKVSKRKRTPADKKQHG